MTVKDAKSIKAEIGPKLKRLRRYQLERKKGRGPLTPAVYLSEVYLIAKETSKVGGLRAAPVVEEWLKENPIEDAETPRSGSLDALIIGATCNEDKRIRSRWARAITAIVEKHGRNLNRLEFDSVLSGLGGIAGAARTIRTPRQRKSGWAKIGKKKISAKTDW